MKKYIYWVIFMVFTAVASVCLYGCRENDSLPVNSNISDKSESLPEVEKKETIILTAAGDCLMHNTQIWSGLQPDGSYNFDFFFTPVQELLQAGDYTSVNFEAPMAGPGTEYTGYPRFNSPDAIARSFKQAGFDLIVTANNHIMDQGINAALRTMKVLREAGLDTVGTFSSPEEKQQFLIKDIRGVKVGYLAYSYGTNGIPIPEQHSYFFNYLEEAKIMSDIAALRPQVDVLALVLHWGTEYAPKPSEAQQKLARSFLEAGADVILGSHPHVIQTMETLELNGKTKFVIYSMGNFISHQQGLERNSGIVLKLKFTKDFSSGETYLEEASYTPTFSYQYFAEGKRYFQVIPVVEAIASLENGQAVAGLTKGDIATLRAVLQSTESQLGAGYFRD